MHGRAGVAAGEVAHDLAEAAELLRRQVAARDVDVDGREAGLALRRARRRRRSARTRARSPFGLPTSTGGAGRAGLLVVEEEVRREVALGDPVALELLLDLAAQLVDAELVDEDLDAGAGAVDAQPVLAVEDAEDRLGDLHVLAVVGLDELVQRRARCAA